jgi:hypothetical protein
MPDGTKQVCPKNCTADLEHAVNITEGGADVKKTWYAMAMQNHRFALWYATGEQAHVFAMMHDRPTVLGSYWEWVWGPVGDAHPGVGYMHRPSSFPLVQFANESGETLCRNIEWPGRHVAKSLHLAQMAYAADHNGKLIGLADQQEHHTAPASSCCLTGSLL